MMMMMMIQILILIMMIRWYWWWWWRWYRVWWWGGGSWDCEGLFFINEIPDWSSCTTFARFHFQKEMVVQFLIFSDGEHDDSQGWATRRPRLLSSTAKAAAGILFEISPHCLLYLNLYFFSCLSKSLVFVLKRIDCQTQLYIYTTAYKDKKT